jgi:retron-type reverse transcriptase
MAKTHNQIFERIYGFDDLYEAYIRARKGKRNRQEVLEFEQNLEGNLIQLQNDLIWGEYRTGTYRQFFIQEPKLRQVAALPFRDRVVQHALVAAIEPIWESRFIYDSYACRPGRGTHRGADRAQEMMRKVKRQHGRIYALKADISKYFANINHATLKRMLHKKISCRRTLNLIDEIIDSTNALSDRYGVGLPIGNLTSQLWANVYLDELDRFVKHTLRESYYIRYMDDFVVIHHDKSHLQRVRADIESYLIDHLQLKTNSKTQVFPVSNIGGRALDFLGYRIWPTHRKIRKSSIGRITRTLRKMRKWYAQGRITITKIQQSITSWIEHARHADTYGLRRAIMRGTISPRN